MLAPKTLDILADNPEFDRIVDRHVELMADYKQAGQHGKTGVLPEFRRGEIVIAHEVKDKTILIPKT